MNLNELKKKIKEIIHAENIYEMRERAFEVYDTIYQLSSEQGEYHQGIFFHKYDIDAVQQIYKEKGIVQAVKYLREKYGIGLRDAKFSIDEIMGNRP